MKIIMARKLEKNEANQLIFAVKTNNKIKHNKQF